MLACFEAFCSETYWVPQVRLTIESTVVDRSPGQGQGLMKRRTEYVVACESRSSGPRNSRPRGMSTRWRIDAASIPFVAHVLASGPVRLRSYGSAGIPRQHPSVRRYTLCASLQRDRVCAGRARIVNRPRPRIAHLRLVAWQPRLRSRRKNGIDLRMDRT